MKPYLLLLVALCLTLKLSAQNWLNDIQDPRVNFFTVQKEFNDWKQQHPEIKRNPGQYEDITDQYYTWEEYWQKHINKDGTLLNEPIVNRNKMGITSRSGGNTANWQEFPYTYTNNIECVGRIDCIAISPVDSNTIWAGSPTGGLWKSTNNGLSWTTNTDTLPRLGVSDIVIDTKNPAIMYISMGDRDNPSSSGNWSIGVYKSTDTGKTWAATGLSWLNTGYIFYDQNIRRLLIDPTNDNTLYAATMIDLDSAVVYKTTDGGNTWKEIFGAAVSQYSGKIDAALMPGNSSTLYVANVNTSGNTQINVSVNGGTTFTSQVLYTDSTANHVLLGVTPANSNYLYVLTANSADYNSLYLSKDGGKTFTLQSDSPNILGYDCSSNPLFGDGQGFYDLTLRVSDTDANNVFVAGINLWQSADAGVTWSSVTCTANNGHSDQHYTLLSPYHRHVIYEGNDGGIFKSNDYGNTWNVISSNMRTTQYRGGESSVSAPDMVIGGSQDNGTMIIENDSSLQVAGGDGTSLSYFDYKDNDIYCLVITSGVYISDSGNIIAPTYSYYAFNPQNINSLALYSYGLYKSYDLGSTWSLVPSDDSVQALSFSVPTFPTGDSNIMFTWLIPGFQLYKINGITGAATELTGNIPHLNVFNYCVSNTDTNKIWVNGTSNISDTSYIYYTSNGGKTWTDITGSLAGGGFGPMVYVANSNDAIYVAGDGGIFYTDASQNGWINWSNGFPNIGANSLSINYPSNELVAITFGRGIWETSLYGTTGINRISVNNNDLAIYPNPSNGNFTIQLKNANQNVQLQFFNVLGENVFSTTLNKVSTPLNLSNHPAGIYLYRAMDEQGNLAGEGKVVIE